MMQLVTEPTVLNYNYTNSKSHAVHDATAPTGTRRQAHVFDMGVYMGTAVYHTSGNQQGRQARNGDDAFEDAGLSFRSTVKHGTTSTRALAATILLMRACDLEDGGLGLEVA